MLGMPPNIWKERESHKPRVFDQTWEDWIASIRKRLKLSKLDGTINQFKTPDEWLDWGLANGLDQPFPRPTSICLWIPFASAVEHLKDIEEKNSKDTHQATTKNEKECLQKPSAFKKWEDMTWTFLSNELVRVEAKGISKKYNYTDLGFTDRRKGDVPDTRWAILSNFAKNNGEITWKTRITKKEKNTMTAAMRDIRKRLKKAFNINDDPFHSYRETNSYKTKFTIKDERDIDNKDNSEPEGFSEEEVKEHLNNSG